MNKLLTRIANSKKASGIMIIGGSMMSCVGSLLILFGSYYRGVKNGADAMDEYYQKEI